MIYHSSGRDRHAPQVAFPPAPKDPPKLAQTPTSGSSNSSASGYSPTSNHSASPAHSPSWANSPAKQHRNSVTAAFGSVRVPSASMPMQKSPTKSRFSVTEAFGSVAHHRRRNTAPTNVCWWWCVCDITPECSEIIRTSRISITLLAMCMRAWKCSRERC